MLLSHLNTDVAENVFSMLRMNRGSYEKNPSAWRFVRNLKQIMFQNLSSAEHSGYTDAKAESLLDIANLPKETDDTEETEFSTEEPLAAELMNQKLPYTIGQEMDVDDDEDDDETHKSLTEDEDRTKITERRWQVELDHNYGKKYDASEKLHNAAALYYAGFAAMKLKAKLKNCETCCKYMIDDKIKDREQALLVELRAYSTTATTSKFGKLTVPSLLFEETVRKVQQIFNEEIKKRQTSEQIVQTWMFDLRKKLANNLTLCCSEDHKEKILKFIITGIIIFNIKNSNKDLKADSSKKYL